MTEEDAEIIKHLFRHMMLPFYWLIPSDQMIIKEKLPPSVEDMLHEKMEIDLPDGKPPIIAFEKYPKYEISRSYWYDGTSVKKGSTGEAGFNRDGLVWFGERIKPLKGYINFED